MKNIGKNKIFILIALCIVALLALGGVMISLMNRVTVTFDPCGGTLKGDAQVKLFKGASLPDQVPERDFYEFAGWYTSKNAGEKVVKAPDSDATLYAHWRSNNQDRKVIISDLTTDRKGNKVRIASKSRDNRVNVSFRLNQYFGQVLAFVDKNDEIVAEIPPEAITPPKDGAEDKPDQTDDDRSSSFGHGEYTVSCTLPDDIWMDSKKTTYYVKSLENDHVDASSTEKVKLKLEGQYEYFDKPIEGSMVWYGGSAGAPKDRAAVIVATDEDSVYVRRDGKDYTWEKAYCMINLPDVCTGPVYDIYNTYDSKFYPISGKCMYSDNGGSGLDRYDTVSKEDAMHENKKTGETTFMVPVQWDFAQTIARAQARAEETGNTLYIVDTFRPMDSVDPVAKAVGDTSLIATGGTSAHNFGFAVDCGWQAIDDDAKPTGEPQVKNLQVLSKKDAIQGPDGNSKPGWWAGVNKLPQEWWHFGDGSLRSGYSAAAKNVGSLYVNKGKCISCSRSSIE